MLTLRKSVGALLLALCVGNFVVGGVAWMCLRGSALNGKVEEERYYVGRKGEMTEVSEGTYTFSYWQGMSEMLTLPLAPVGVWMLNIRFRRRPEDAASGGGR
jgi:hypothetical protein